MKSFIHIFTCLKIISIQKICIKLFEYSGISINKFCNIRFVIHKIFFAHFIILFLFFSCSNKQGEKRGVPQGIIGIDRMAKVLADIHLTHSAITIDILDYKKQYDKLKEYYPTIFSKHHITPEEYQNSLIYYQKNPDQYLAVYDQVIKIIMELQVEKK